MSNPVKFWDESVDGEINFNAVRNLYPNKGYRLGEHLYLSDEEISGTMRGGIWYVISGCGRVIFEDERILKAKQIAEMPQGNYKIKALGDEPFHFVVVWKLPPPLHNLATVPDQSHF